MYEVDLSIVSVLLFQLELCQEEDFYKVYEVDLHGTDITHIPDLEKVRDSQNAQTQEGTCAYTCAYMRVHVRAHALTHTHTHTHTHIRFLMTCYGNLWIRIKKSFTSFT